MRITREEIITNAKTHIYLYADDRTRKAQKGQAEVAIGLSNCFPITTKLLPCKDSLAYLTDFFLEEYIDILSRDIDQVYNYLMLYRIPRSVSVVIFPKIGRGCAEMPQRAPKCYAHLREKLNLLDINYAG